MWYHTAMVAAPIVMPKATYDPHQDQYVLLDGVPWATYVVLRDSIDSPGVHMTYLEGRLEIMSPGRKHEVNKTQLARLLELFCLERDIPLYGYGEMTLRNEAAKRGLEPDESYCRDRDRPTPQIVLEVVVTRGALDKLDVYRKLGVQEVWVFEDEAFTLFGLRSERYVTLEVSEVLPEAPLDRIAHYALEDDQHAALKRFRAELRDAPLGRPQA